MDTPRKLCLDRLSSHRGCMIFTLSEPIGKLGQLDRIASHQFCWVKGRDLLRRLVEIIAHPFGGLGEQFFF